MKIINLTPHVIRVLNKDLQVIVEFPSEGVARLSSKTVDEDFILITGGAIPLTRTEFGKPEGLPEEAPATMLIVSGIVKGALPGRSDLVVPTGMVLVKDGELRLASDLKEKAGWAPYGCTALGL